MFSNVRRPYPAPTIPQMMACLAKINDNISFLWLILVTSSFFSSFSLFNIALIPFLLRRIAANDIADPPILSSSPENGSATAMQGRLWLTKRSNSSACRVPSLQNVPVRPENAQSAHSFFWDYLRILKKISITQGSGLLYHMRRLRKEEYLKKTENLDSART